MEDAPCEGEGARKGLAVILIEFIVPPALVCT